MAKRQQMIRRPTAAHKRASASKRAVAPVDLKKVNAGLRRELADAMKRQSATAEVFNGVGIPPEYCEKLFQPFFTTKPTGEGMGLGLSISYEIITQQHGGTITVDSEVGDFTEFTVRLPRHRHAVA
jgi:nitrogen-specific signal transduction histidine kinase